MLTRLFRTVFVVVFGCVTLWHCAGCDLLEETVCDGLMVEEASTSELVQELIGRGFDRFEDE